MAAAWPPKENLFSVGVLDAVEYGSASDVRAALAAIEGGGGVVGAARGSPHSPPRAPPMALPSSSEAAVALLESSSFASLPSGGLAEGSLVSLVPVMTLALPVPASSACLAAG
jgi:hypothetical protein